MTLVFRQSIIGLTAMQKEKIRIVVADDHPIFRDGLCMLLALEEDFEVIAQAQDGRQVLEILRHCEPDILLLDLEMPGLDGLATLERLQQSRTKTRVIVLTASEDKNLFIQAMKLGTSGIVLKQTATELLIKSIRKVHAGEIWLDSHTTAAVIRQFVANDEAAPLPMPSGAPTRERERSPLSQREREIVALVAQGFKNKEMAEKMFISEQTVRICADPSRYGGKGGSGTPVPASFPLRLEHCPTRRRKPGRNSDL